MKREKNKREKLLIKCLVILNEAVFIKHIPYTAFS